MALTAVAASGRYLVVPVVTTAPGIDGSLDDVCWKQVPLVGADGSASEKGTAPGSTRFAIARDQDHLYLAVRCDDPAPERIVANVPSNVRDADLMNDDHVRFWMSPQNTREGVLDVRINANGALSDSWMRPVLPTAVRKPEPSKHQFRPKEGEALSAGRVTDAGYQIECAIRRRKSFLPDYYRVKIHTGESWQFNLARVRRGETVSAWTGPVPQDGGYGSHDGGFGSIVMGPAQIAITRPHFGTGTAGTQHVRAWLTNLTDRKQELRVRVQGEAAGRRWGHIVNAGPSGVEGFERRLALAPGQSAPIEESIKLNRHRRDVRREIGYTLPPNLAPGDYLLRGRLVSRNSTEIAVTDSKFEIFEQDRRPSRVPARTDAEGVIRLTLREMAGTSLNDHPITFGVPFPDGRVASPDGLRLVDAASKPIRFHARAAGRWRKSGFVKWALIDATVDSPAGATTGLRLRYGEKGGGSHGTGTFRTEQRDGQLTVVTGPLKFIASQASGRLIDRIWVDKTKTAGSPTSRRSRGRAPVSRRRSRTRTGPSTPPI